MALNSVCYVCYFHNRLWTCGDSPFLLQPVWLSLLNFDLSHYVGEAPEEFRGEPVELTVSTIKQLKEREYLF